MALIWPLLESLPGLLVLDSSSPALQNRENSNGAIWKSVWRERMDHATLQRCKHCVSKIDSTVPSLLIFSYQ